MRGCVEGRNEVAHALEFLRHRGQFSAVAVVQGRGEPGRQADAGPLDDRFQLAQPRRARMVAESAWRTVSRSLPRRIARWFAAVSAADNNDAMASLTAPWLAATHAWASPRS